MDLITVTREEGLRFAIRVRDHVVETDMAKGEGGADGGFAPVELLGASVGACFATMIQAYCQTRGFTDGDVSVSLTLELTEKPNRVGAIVADVELPRDVPEKEREKIRKLLLRLPVPATLRDPPRIDVDLV